MATLTVTTTTNYTGQSLNDIDSIVFATSGTATATFGSNQFGPGLIQNDVAITGDPNQNIITINLSAIGFFSAGLWTFSSWNAATDLIILNAFVGTNGLVGSSQRDQINGGDDDDTLSGGAGDDIVLGGTGNDTLDGGTGNDQIGLGSGDDRVILRPGGGADSLFDFTAGGGNSLDEIDVAAFAGINSLVDILARTTQQGSHAVIDFGNGDTLTLQNVSKSALAASDFVGLEENLNDFNGDGRADILWRHDNGTTNVFQMNGATVEGGSNTSVQVDNSWTALEKADFNGDDRADVLWRHANGTTNIFLMDGATVIGGSNTSRQLPNAWAVQEAADFNGDGKADILWRHTTIGSVRMFLMDGPTVLTMDDENISVQPSINATVQGTGDFDRDGRADILFRHADGTTNVFFMDGPTVRFAQSITQQVDNTWSVRAVNDFNGDGRADILWRHANGTSNIFLMDGANVLGGSNLSIQVDNAWSVQDTGDYNGDGRADILWRHQNGTTNVFLMDGATVLGGSNISVQVDNNWHVI